MYSCKGQINKILCPLTLPSKLNFIGTEMLSRLSYMKVIKRVVLTASCAGVSSRVRTPSLDAFNQPFKINMLLSTVLYSAS